MTGATPTILLASTTSAIVAMQDMPLPEKVTLLTLFGLALGAMIMLARSLGTRMANSVDRSSDVISALMLEVKRLLDHNEEFKKIIEQQQAAHAQERDKAMAAFTELRDTIRDAFQDRRRQRGL